MSAIRFAAPCPVPWGVAMTMALALSSVSTAWSQSAMSFAATGGVASYDLSGTGETVVVGARVTRGFSPFLAVEASADVFAYTTQFEERSTFVIPEIALVVGGTRGTIAPFLSAGLGYGLVVSGPDQSDVSLSAATGIQPRLSRRVRSRLEIRFRNLGTTDNRSIVSLQVGVTWNP